MLGHSAVPYAKSSIDVNRIHPFLQMLFFGLVLLRFLTLGLQDKVFSVSQLDDKVGTVFANCTLVYVGDFKSEVIVFNPGGNVIIII